MRMPRHLRSFPVSCVVTLVFALGALSPNAALAISSITNISNPSVTEGNSGSKTVTFVVTANCEMAVNVIISWQLDDGTATTADNDYVDASGGTGSFLDDVCQAAGIEQYNVTATINGDTSFEPDETFQLVLTGASVGSPSFSNSFPTGTATILNDDVANQPPDCSGAAIAAQDADGSCQASISGSDVTGVTDPDGDALTIQVSPSTLSLGANTVTVSADDGNGGMCSKDITVNVIDNAKPVISCPANANLQANASCEATYSGPAATATDNCDASVAISANPTLPASFSGVGGNTITYTATDDNGNAATCDQNVTLVDDIDPVITCPADATLEADAFCDATYGGPAATATDNCDAGVTVSASPALPAQFNGVGDNTITYTATDDSGNGDTCDQSVSVVDVTAPEITLIGDNPVTLECSIDTYTEQGATVVDNCDPGPSLVIDGSAVDESMVGTYAVTYDATDASGNTAMETRDVIVEDTTPPEITVADDPIVLWPPNHKYATIDLDDVVVEASDICDENVDAGDVVITLVSSDEEEDAVGGGDGKTVDDIVIGPLCRTVDLRKERQGGGNGRVYTLDLAVSDASGNTGTASYQVQVPHEKKGTAIDDGAAYDVGGSCVSLLTSGASSVFKGRILDALTGMGVDGVTVRGPGETVAESDENGRYKIRLPGDGTTQLRLEKPGYFNRRTYVDALERVTRANLTLIPKAAGFSMEFFQEVFREPLTTGTPMTRRWVEEPVFELYSRSFEQIPGDSRLRAGTRLPKRLRASLEETLRADVPLYSGGVLRGDQIRWVDHQRGEAIGVPRHRAGRVRVVVREGSCPSGAEAVTVLKWSDAGILEGGRIDLFADCGGRDRGVFSHALAHHVGLFHPESGAKLSLPSIMGGAEADGPTEADVLHARVLYQRFPGNQGPDSDQHPEKLSSKASAAGAGSVSLSCRR